MLTHLRATVAVCGWRRPRSTRSRVCAALTIVWVLLCHCNCMRVAGAVVLLVRLAAMGCNCGGDFEWKAERR